MRIIVTSDVVTHNFPAPRSDFLMECTDYQVPPGEQRLLREG